MGRLFFYSDQVVESPGNLRLDHFAGMEPSQIKIGYIPSTEDKEREYFKAKVQYYHDYGIKNIIFFDLYSEFDSSKIGELLSCDIIHLSAGNPIEFRNAIRLRKMNKVLWDYFNKDGTIIGVSGGAVQLGKSAKLFQLFTGSFNNEKMDTLHFADFEFLPHFNRWSGDFKQQVLQYSQTTGTLIYAVNDGDGLIVEDGNIQFVGDVKILNNGNAFLK
ncbi:Type 1 glutamine amidotransferase-like domain-containing protein [Peribacillus sp. SCS-37]|uniref:Type 1 glutamine amidotransferase-like domain-containing protein n=1 Tax=Paraperibacillus esterisolvens TaxID=3115296 RepID=UPI003905C844